MKRITDSHRDIWIAGIAFVLLWYWSDEKVVLYCGVLYIIACYALPTLKSINHRFWTKLTSVLQSIFQPILFGLIYFIVVVPIGVLFRIFNRRINPTDSSFKDIDRSIGNRFFEEPW